MTTLVTTVENTLTRAASQAAEHGCDAPLPCSGAEPALPRNIAFRRAAVTARRRILGSDTHGHSAWPKEGAITGQNLTQKNNSNES